MIVTVCIGRGSHRRATPCWLHNVLLVLTCLVMPVSQAAPLPDFTALISEEVDTVVNVRVVTRVEATNPLEDFDFDQLPDFWRRFFDQIPQFPFPDSEPRQQRGFGSGFIISEDGYIVTNAHVVDGADDIRVGLQNRTEYTAQLVGLDEQSDIALLKLDADGLPAVRLGDSDKVIVGQWVIAIGSPFGLDYSATQGIVSAIARNLPSEAYIPFIQTDVAVNPGNSGGPLFNTDGEVIGVNSMIISRSGGYQGLSFAIPVNTVKHVVTQLRDKGYASRGSLGVVIQDMSQELARSFGLDHPTGALVASVAPYSPADKAGIQSGDIILVFDGVKVTRSGSLPPLVGETPIGRTVEIEILRNAESKNMRVTIGELVEDKPQEKPRKPESDSRLGLVLGEIDKADREQLGITHGVWVNEVSPEGRAAEAGLEPGDIILSLNHQDVQSVRQFGDLVDNLPEDKVFPLLILRNGNALYLAIGTSPRS